LVAAGRKRLLDLHPEAATAARTGLLAAGLLVVGALMPVLLPGRARLGL
jgi:hypothetical protein